MDNEKREIKFRAWDSVHEVMINPYCELREGERFYAHDLTNSCAVIADGSVMQYTGLKDKNGVEIYEGDIVLFTYWWFDGNVAESVLKGTVVFISEHSSFGLEGVKNAEWIKHIGAEEGSSDTAPFAKWQFSIEDIEVIGNIYANSELLNK